MSLLLKLSLLFGSRTCSLKLIASARVKSSLKDNSPFEVATQIVPFLSRWMARAFEQRSKGYAFRLFLALRNRTLPSACCSMQLMPPPKVAIQNRPCPSSQMSYVLLWLRL